MEFRLKAEKRMTDQTLSASVEKESEIQRMSLWALNTFASISSLQSEGVAINQEAEKLKNNFGIYMKPGMRS